MKGFRSVYLVATCAGAALACYLVSLRVASERAALEDVETKIVLAQGDLRVLQTEIGTRGRLAQLERWNASVLAMSAPAADQFVGSSFELAKLTRPQPKVDFQAPVVLASAPAPQPKPAITTPGTDDSGAPAAAAAGPTPTQLLHEASLKTETREVPVKPVANVPQATGPLTKGKSADRLAAAAKPVTKKSVDKPGLAAAQPVTKPVRIAKVDPLAPLPEKHSAKPPKDIAPGR